MPLFSLGSTCICIWDHTGNRAVSNYQFETSASVFNWVYMLIFFLFLELYRINQLPKYIQLYVFGPLCQVTNLQQ